MNQQHTRVMSPEGIDQIKTLAVSAVDSNRHALEQLCREIHARAELSSKEFESARLLTAALEQGGLTVESPVAELATAFRGQVSGTGRGPTVGLIAEYDALPEIGHACGHNIVSTGAVGAAIALAATRAMWPGTVVILGTPAEEEGGGKIQMLDTGVFDDIDAIVYAHPYNRNQAWQRSLAVVRLDLAFHGRAAHAASAPHKGVNALDALIQTFVGINALRQHVSSDVRIHGIITHGGVKPNIVPAFATGQFYVRARTDATTDHVVRQVVACAKGAAEATGARLEIREHATPRYRPLRPNLALAAVVAGNMRSLGLPDVKDGPDDRGGMGSVDLGNVSQKVPALEALIMVAPGLELHTVDFAAAAVSDQGIEAMLTSARVLAMSAIDLLCNPQVLAGVRADFARNLDD